MHRLVTAVVILAALEGCAHVELRCRATKQAGTLADLYEQQVLDNLAMFAEDLGALPYFSYASQGTASVGNQGALSWTSLWQRNARLTWQLQPVNDPRKLALMRCIYQQTIAAHSMRPIPAECPDCTRLFQNFYTGDPELRIDHRPGLGTVTVDCLAGPKWLAIGCTSCVPVRRHETRVGRYGNARVWTLPGKSDELAKLTLVILDYALHDPPAQPKKTVSYYLDNQGELTSADKALLSVSGEISASQPSDALSTLPYVTALEHICSRNPYGLTLDILLGIDPRTLSNPHANRDVRQYFHINDVEWQAIIGLLVKLRSHQVDAFADRPLVVHDPLSSRRPPSDAWPGVAPHRENISHALPAPLPLGPIESGSDRSRSGR
ncbi:MAG TPA: hypothetical protein VHC19_19330 [Pirellulales bacterium]|nr:hypothetical protein [Pirellulales bacterium]